MFQRHLFWMVAAVFIILLIFLIRPFAVSSDDTLFAPIAGKAPADLTTIEAARRVRPVYINWNTLRPHTEELRLNLFDNASLTATMRRVDSTVTGGFVWVGDITGEVASTVSLSVQNGVLSGAVYRLGREWAVIRHVDEAPDDTYLIIELDPHAPQPDGLDTVVPQPPVDKFPSLVSPQDASCEEDGSFVDLMVVYTSATREMAGGRDTLEALISQLISDMNTANDISAVAFDWRLVHMMEVDYAESGSLAADLKNLKAMGDNVSDDVRVARDLYKADLVSMLVSAGNNNTCGYAYQTNALESWFESYSYSVAALDYPGQPTCSTLTVAHEFGHNLGNAHDRGHTAGAVLYPFSYGYQSTNETFRDIMSYDCPNGCPRINQWSNPDIWYMGEPTGIAFETDPANAADLARSMNEVRVLASNFRANCIGDINPTPTNEGPPPGSTDTPEPTDTPPTAGPTIEPDPSPTSGSNASLNETLYLPAVVQK